MHVQIIEFGYKGHRLTHVHLVVEALLPLVEHITVTLSDEAFESEEFQTHMASLSDRVELDLSLPPGDVKPAAWPQVRKINRLLVDAVRRVHGDHVWLPTADIVSQSMGLAAVMGRGSPFASDTEAEGIMHRCAPAYTDRRWYRRLKLRAIGNLISRAPWTHLHTVDHLAYQWMRSLGGPIAQHARLLADPVDPVPAMTHTEARRRLKLPEGGRYIGCCGLLDYHKGMHLLVPAFDKAKLADDDRLLLVGRQKWYVREMIDQSYSHLLKNGRLIVFDRYVSNDDLTASLAAMDVVCTPSADHQGISNIVLRAQAMRRPVLGCSFGWQGYVVPALKLGWTCAVEDLDVFGRMIASCLDAAPNFPVSPAIDRIMAFHSRDNYAAGITQRIRQRLGLDPSPHRREWQWVLDGM